MREIDTIVILNYYKRKNEGLIVKNILTEICAPLGINVKISFDDGGLGLWGNYKQALMLPSQTQERFRLIIHDDVTVARQIVKKMLHVLRYAPETFISFYCPRNKGYRNALASGAHVLKTHSNFWVQAFCTPTSVKQNLIEWCDRNIEAEYKWEDERIKFFSRVNDIPIHAILPSLIQYLGAYRSTFNIPGKVAGLRRYSEMYNSEFDVEKVDWVNEFNNPVTNEQATDSDKKLQKESQND